MEVSETSGSIAGHDLPPFPLALALPLPLAWPLVYPFVVTLVVSSTGHIVTGLE